MKETTIKRIRSTESKKNLEKVIELKNLVKRYGQQTVVDGINLNIRRGEFVTFLGPSGCGKTTTLRMIAGFETPTGGQIFLEGQDVTNVPPHQRPVNTVFQKYALFPHLDVFGNIAFGLKLKKDPKLSKQEIKEKVEQYLTLVGLADYGHRDVESLSGGQQQRVAIARALVNQPRVLLLDEPLGALDLKMRKEMQQELKRMHRELGITFIYVTHDQEEALTMSDTIVVINDGAIQQVGTPKEIYDEPKNAFVADFIGESNIISGTMIKDFKVKFLDVEFDCADKGFPKNEPVDIVIRPEDIVLKKGGKGKLSGKVISSTFKGTYFEQEIEIGEYQFTSQTQTEVEVGSQVSLEIAPDAIHIMAKEDVINEIETYVTGENEIEIAGKTFEVANAQFEKGTPVTAFIEFEHVELTDDEDDGVVGANVTSTIYMGDHYQVQLWTDDDTGFIVNSHSEWDMGDRVGIVIKPEHIRLEIRDEYVESDETEVAEG